MAPRKSPSKKRVPAKRAGARKSPSKKRASPKRKVARKSPSKRSGARRSPARRVMRRGTLGMKSLQAAEKQARMHAMKSAQCMRRARTAEMAALRAAKRVAKLPRGSAARKASAKTVRANVMKARRASQCVTRELAASRRYAAKAAVARKRMRARIMKSLKDAHAKAKRAAK